MEQKFQFTDLSIFKSDFEINLDKVLFWSRKPELIQADLSQWHKQPEKMF